MIVVDSVIGYRQIFRSSETNIQLFFFFLVSVDLPIYSTRNWSCLHEM